MDKLTKEEKGLLEKLDTPAKIQDYLESIPFNHEEHGETCMSPRLVLKHKKAHCLEGAMLASCALILQKKKPIIVSLKVTEEDWDHIITIFKDGKYYGAISKTNHAVLGYRDPVYKNIRELAMSYFHEYFLVKNGEKTMRGYSLPINMNRFGTHWITSEDQLFPIAEKIADAKHIFVLPQKREHVLRRATKLERVSADISRDGL